MTRDDVHSRDPRPLAAVLGAAVLVGTGALAWAQAERYRRPAALTARAVPSSAAAREVLGRAFVAALQRDRDRFCGATTSHPGMCHDHWESAGGDAAAPTVPPVVASERVVDGYRVLVVCGTDGLGRPYHGDFVVETGDGGTVEALLGPFWYGHHFSGRLDPGEVAVASPRRGPAVPRPCPSR